MGTSLANLTKSRRRLIDVLGKQLKQIQSRSNPEMLVSWSLFRASQCALRLFQIFHPGSLCCSRYEANCGCWSNQICHSKRSFWYNYQSSTKGNEEEMMVNISVATL